MSQHKSLVDEMKSWQDEWVKVSEDFQKPQCIVDAIEEHNLYKNLHEEKKMATNGAEVAKSLDTQFTVNPTHFATLGNDQDLRVTPNFSDGPLLRELNALKLSLYELEGKVNAAYAQDEEKKENSLRKELDSVRSKVDELSNKLTPHPIDDRS